MHAISPFYLDGRLTGEDLQTDMCMRVVLAAGILKSVYGTGNLGLVARI